MCVLANCCLLRLDDRASIPFHINPFLSRFHFHIRRQTQQDPTALSAFWAIVSVSQALVQDWFHPSRDFRLETKSFDNWKLVSRCTNWNPPDDEISIKGHSLSNQCFQFWPVVAPTLSEASNDWSDGLPPSGAPRRPAHPRQGGDPAGDGQGLLLKQVSQPLNSPHLPEKIISPWELEN